MQDYSFTLFISAAFVVCLISCNGSAEIQLPTIQPSIDCEIHRFDQEFASINIESVDQAVTDIRTKYGPFAELFFNQILSRPSGVSLESFINMTVSDTLYQDLYSEVQNQYSDLSILKDEVCQTLENYMSLFPEANLSVPKVYTFISGFAYQCFVFSDGDSEGIGLGLDLFLGQDFDYQSINPKDPAFSDYLTRTYDREYITRKMSEILIEDKIPPPTKNDFMTYMIWGGKKLFILDKILNFKPDSIITEFSEPQLNWCRLNEAGIWNYFFEKELFYATNPNLFNKLISPSPNVPDMPPQAPGGVANYIGWQIVTAFMERHPELTVSDLLKIMDAQSILDQSRYKPNI